MRRMHHFLFNYTCVGIGLFPMNAFEHGLHTCRACVGYNPRRGTAQRTGALYIFIDISKLAFNEVCPTYLLICPHFILSQYA